MLYFAAQFNEKDIFFSLLLIKTVNYFLVSFRYIGLIYIRISYSLYAGVAHPPKIAVVLPKPNFQFYCIFNIFTYARFHRNFQHNKEFNEKHGKLVN